MTEYAAGPAETEIKTDIIDSFSRYFIDHSIKKDGSVLLALSGGVDSVVLLYLLVHYSSFKLSVFHLNHGLRDVEVLKKEEKLVTSLCAKWSLPLQISRLPSGTAAKSAAKHNQSLEEYCRYVRHSFLCKMANRIGADYIAMAHHLDDQLETVLMRLSQGAGVAGLGGIPPRNGKIIRPLFYCNKQQVVKFAAEKKLPHCFDLSNLDSRYLRNFLRRQIIPLLKQKFPKIDQMVGRSAGYLKEAAQIVSAEAAATVKWRPSRSACLSCSKQKLFACSELLFAEAIFAGWRQLAALLQQKLTPIPFRFIKELRRLSQNGNNCGSLNRRGFCFSFDQNHFFIMRQPQWNKHQSVELFLPINCNRGFDYRGCRIEFVFSESATAESAQADISALIVLTPPLFVLDWRYRHQHLKRFKKAGFNSDNSLLLYDRNGARAAIPLVIEPDDKYRILFRLAHQQTLCSDKRLMNMVVTKL